MKYFLALCACTSILFSACKKDEAPAPPQLAKTIEVDEIYNGSTVVFIHWDLLTSADKAYILRSTKEDGAFDTIAIVDPYEKYIDSLPVLGETNYYQILLWTADAGFSEPSNITSLHIDKLLVKITQLGSAGSGLGQFHFCQFHEHNCVAFDNTFYYIIDGENFRIQRLDLEYRPVDFIYYSGGDSWTTGTSDFIPNTDFFPARIVYANSHLYILDLKGRCGSSAATDNHILKFSTDGKLVAKTNFETGIGTNSGLAVDKYDQYYLFDDYSIQKYESSANQLGTFGEYGSAPGQFLQKNNAGIVCDGEENIYVTDTDSETIVVYNTSGNYIKTISLDETIQNHSLIADKGFLYILSYESAGVKTYVSKINYEGIVVDKWRVPHDYWANTFDVKNGKLFQLHSDQVVNVYELP